MTFAKLALACLFLSSASALASPQDVSRGEYLARASDCVVCHTVSDGAPYAGGLKMNTPVGAIYSTNITPEPDTGIGKYSFEDFDRALRKGVAADGHRLYPAMPYPSFARLTEADSRALYDFFQTSVAPVRARNTPSAIPAPWNQRWSLSAWNLVGSGAPFRPDPAFDDEWNRGAYLVQGPGHCGACHTPRGWLYQEKGLDEKSGAFLSGAYIDGWSAPNLRGDLNSGLGRWTVEEVAEYLKTGRNRFGSAFGSMRDVVAYSTRWLSDDDARAMAKYLKSLSPSIDRARPVWVPDARALEALRARKFDQPGAATYTRQCASCHGLDGAGGAGLPPLAGNPAVLDQDAASLINIVLNGAPALESESTQPAGSMPQFRSFLSDRDLAEVVSFVRSAWGNRAPSATDAQVADLRAATALGGERTLIRRMR